MGMEYLKTVIGIAPVADAFSGTVASDVVNFKNHETVSFLITKGVGLLGTSTITVEACDDVVPTTQTAIPFRYQEILTGDTAGEEKRATATGFVTTAGSDQQYLITVKRADLGGSAYGYLRLKAVEVVDGPVLGGVTILMGDPRYNCPVQETALV